MTADLSPYDPRAAAHAASKRRLRRDRRRRLRGRMVPMCGLIPRRKDGEYGDVAVKEGMKRRHHVKPRRWGKQEVRWETGKWQRANGRFEE